MATARLIPLLLLLSLAGPACDRLPPQSHAELYVFGTLVSLTAATDDEEAANRAFAEIGTRFQQMHRDWHAWEPGELTRINAALANGSSTPASLDIIDLVQKSRKMETASGGRFNAAAGALVALWGFHTSQYPVLGPPPIESAIEDLVQAHPSALDISIHGLILSSSNPVAQLDFGGIAKGVAVDEAVQILKEHRISAGIVNAGGDLRAYGNGAERPWRIAVQAPGGGVLGGLEVVGDEAVFTSGNYQRFRKDGNERYPHILDPATGWPVQGVSSATVIASEGWRADAAATALVVAGPEAFEEVVTAMEIDAALLVGENNTLHMTAAMAARLKLTDANVWHIKRYPAQ